MLLEQPATRLIISLCMEIDMERKTDLQISKIYSRRSIWNLPVSRGSLQYSSTTELEEKFTSLVTYRQPVCENPKLSAWHLSHLTPVTPGLHTHCPVELHCNEAEPTSLQLHGWQSSEGVRRKKLSRQRSHFGPAVFLLQLRHLPCPSCSSYTQVSARLLQSHSEKKKIKNQMFTKLKFNYYNT